MKSNRIIGVLGCLILMVLPLCGQDQFRPLYLSGNVSLQDGSPPPEPVRIELICSGRIQPQALTKTDGSFNFRVGGDQSRELVSASSDRSQPSAPVGTSGPNPPQDLVPSFSNPSFVNMSSCEVRGVLAGFRSSTVKLGRRSVFESSDIGTLVLTPLAEGETLSRDPLVSVNTLKAPTKALDYFEKGQEKLLKERPDAKGAANEFEKAVEAYPEFSAAWNLLAEARIQREDLEGAQEALQKAIETDPGFVIPRVTLSSLELEQGNFEAAIESSKGALEIVPDMGEPLYYQGTAYAKLGDMENAKLTLEKVAQGTEETGFPKSHYILGVIYAQTGELGKAVEHCQRYLELEPDSDAAAAVRRQLESWKASGLIP